MALRAASGYFASVACVSLLLSAIALSFHSFEHEHALLTSAGRLLPPSTHRTRSLSRFDDLRGSIFHSRAPESASKDMTTVYQRRVSTIVGKLKPMSEISSWLSTLENSGKWPDSEIDYTTGCAARRANWPAQWHWQRIVVMAGAWRGGTANKTDWVHDAGLRDAIGRAMEYWFNRDMTTSACLDNGGQASCPCENPGNTLWNTNWYSNIILIPGLVGQSCLLLNATLTSNEATYCGRMTKRSYEMFDRDINGVGYLTGANTLDVARISVDAALITHDAAILEDAYRRVHDELTIRDEVKSDGIRPDGSFGQHKGILYNGNYGKDYSNAALDLEVAAAGTQYAAGAPSKNALETLFEGHRWMIYANSLDRVLHFDFSSIGRMITFPVIEDQASASIQMNITTVLELGNLWSSTSLKNFAASLMPDPITNANAGTLIGTKMFYANDYLVHRGNNYVSTLKMYSSRTQNTECINSQNPKGFHLSDGTTYTYLRGDEYEDISAAWDWDLVPGITVDYQRTAFNCGQTGHTGLEAFVGGVSDGTSGIAVMRYKNPLTRALEWQKTWFFLNGGVHHVMVNIISADASSPIYSVLEQKRLSGITVVNDTQAPSGATTFRSPANLWHANVGYSFPRNTPAVLNLRRGQRTGDWSTIGTSTQPPTQVNMWAAWLQHQSGTMSAPVEYSVYPGLSHADFVQKRGTNPVHTIENSRNASAIYDKGKNQVLYALWRGGYTTLGFQVAPAAASLTVSSAAPIVLMLSLKDGRIVASDPSQNLAGTSVTFQYGSVGQLPAFWKGSGRSKTVTLNFPRGGFAGSTVFAQL